MNYKIEIKNAYSKYANSTLELQHFTSFWSNYLSKAQEVYHKKPFKLETTVSGSVFTTRDVIENSSWDILTSDYFHKLTVGELNEKAQVLNSFILNYSLIRFYLLFEDFIYHLLWIADYKELERPVNENYKNRIKSKVLEYLKIQGVLKRHKNNDFIHTYFKYKYSGAVERLLNSKVSTDLELSFSNLLELLTKLRHTNSHNINIDKDTFNGLKSDKSTKAYIEMILEFDEIEDLIHLRIKKDGLNVLIDHTGILLSNLSRLIFEEDDFKFLGLEKVKVQ